MPLLEYAKSSAATCWKCHRKIGHGTLRLQTSVGGHGGNGSDPGYGSKKWMHLRCYRPSRPVELNWFKGTISLTEEDNERLERLIENWNDRKAVGGTGEKKKKRKKVDSEEDDEKPKASKSKRKKIYKTY